MSKLEIKAQIKELEDELRKLYALEKYPYKELWILTTKLVS